MTLKIATLNVRGLRDEQKCKSLISWYNSQRIDILCLQETYISNENERQKFSKHCLGAIQYHWYATNHSKGLAILLRQSPDMTTSVVSRSERHQTILFKIDFHNFYLTNVYAPNILTEKVRYFDQLCDTLKGEQNHIVCGDFNAIPDLALNKRSQATNNSRKAPTRSYSNL